MNRRPNKKTDIQILKVEKTKFQVICSIIYCIKLSLCAFWHHFVSGVTIFKAMCQLLWACNPILLWHPSGQAAITTRRVGIFQSRILIQKLKSNFRKSWTSLENQSYRVQRWTKRQNQNVQLALFWLMVIGRRWLAWNIFIAALTKSAVCTRWFFFDRKL